MNRTPNAITIAAAALLATAAAAAAAADFHMIHATRGNTAVGVYTPDGPRLGSMQKAPNRLDFIAYDSGTGTYFGQQTSTLGVIENGKLTPVETPESVKLSHSGGLAFDASRGSVLVASRSGAGTVLFEYAPATGAWTEIGNIGRDDFRGLACDGEQGTIYVLDKPHRDRGCTNLRVFSRSGAQVASVDLSSPIPYYDELRPKVQLTFADESLYAMVTYEKKHPRVVDAIYEIDPASGVVQRASWKATVDVTSKTWPGWKEGPAPSPSMSAAGARGTGFYSHYATPESLVQREAGELHVVSVGSGETNYLEWLKKVKKVGASSRKDGGVSIELELDLDAEINHPVVEVHVEKAAKPITLVLVSGSTVIWSIDAAPGAEIEKVITCNAPHFSESRVVGVAEGIVASGGSVSAAHAWEMDRSSSASDFDEMIAAIREATGLRESTFQGLDRGAAFRVPFAATGGPRHAVVDE